MERTPETRGRMRRSLHTKRLSLDSFTLDDTSELHEIFSDPQTHTIGDGPFTRISQTTSWIERRIAARATHGHYWYGVRDQDTRRLIGNCGVFVGRTGVAEPELGYEIRRDLPGLGLCHRSCPRGCTGSGARRHRTGLGDDQADERCPQALAAA